MRQEYDRCTNDGRAKEAYGLVIITRYQRKWRVSMRLGTYMIDG